MHPVALVISSGISFLALALVLYPLEKACPAKPGQKIFRPDWLLDLSFMLGQYFVWGGLVLAALLLFREHLPLIPDGLRVAVASQPWWVQALQVILLADLFVYWGHRLQHHIPWLWQFHAVHHSAEHLDWLASHREHPVDALYTQTLINLPAFLLGFPIGTLTGLIAFRGLWAIYIHSNVRLPLGPFKVLLGSPELHHWHHAKDRHAGNYGNLCPIMDVLFNTYRDPKVEPEELGLSEPFPKTYWGQLLHPFRIRPKHNTDQPAKRPVSVE
ncbi:MAG: sterol desaturase family protein [Verrucomicrobiales bacterium]